MAFLADRYILAYFLTETSTAFTMLHALVFFCWLPLAARTYCLKRRDFWPR